VVRNEKLHFEQFRLSFKISIKFLKISTEPCTTGTDIPCSPIICLGHLCNSLNFFLTEEYFPEVTGESAAHRKQRYTNYKECWDSMKSEIEVTRKLMKGLRWKKGLTYQCRNERNNMTLELHILINQE